MNRRAFALAVATSAYLMAALAALAHADPILKPHKYSGPIPQSSISLRIGMLGGANNEEMIDYLTPQPPFTQVSEDFGNGLTFEIAYMHKPHPNFGVRVNASLSLLSSTASGDMVPQIPDLPDTIPLPLLNYNREFKVQLWAVEVSGVYHWGDAAVKEFQPYAGGGFTFGFPHEEITETRIDDETGEPFTEEIVGVPTSASEWGVSAGVHAVGGAIYYLTNQLGITGEARVQLLESKFDQITVVNEVGELETASFVVDYTGFFLTIGVLYAF